MRRKNLVFLFLSIVSSVVLLATTAFSKSDDVVTLKYSRWSPASSTPAKLDQKWADLLEEKSQGRIKVKCYFDGSLAKMLENYRACQTGVADIAYYVIGINPGLTELNKVVYLPFMGQKDMETGSKAYKELLEVTPELQGEFPGMKVVGPRMMPAYHMHFTKKDIRRPEDMKGMKVIADTTWSIVLNGIGAAPIKLPVGDWYMSLERNLAEGHIVHYPAIFIYKTLDLLKHHTMFGEGGCMMAAEVMLFNNKKWNQIPSDLQKIILDSVDERIAMQMEGDNQLIDKAIQFAKDNNHTFTYANDEDILQWKEAVKPVHTKWIEDNKKRGPSQLIYERAHEIIQKHNNMD